MGQGISMKDTFPNRMIIYDDKIVAIGKELNDKLNEFIKHEEFECVLQMVGCLNVSFLLNMNNLKIEGYFDSFKVIPLKEVQSHHALIVMRAEV